MANNTASLYTKEEIDAKLLKSLTIADFDLTNAMIQGTISDDELSIIKNNSIIHFTGIEGIDVISTKVTMNGGQQGSYYYFPFILQTPGSESSVISPSIFVIMENMLGLGTNMFTMQTNTLPVRYAKKIVIDDGVLTLAESDNEYFEGLRLSNLTDPKKGILKELYQYNFILLPSTLNDTTSIQFSGSVISFNGPNWLGSSAGYPGRFDYHTYSSGEDVNAFWSHIAPEDVTSDFLITVKGKCSKLDSTTSEIVALSPLGSNGAWDYCYIEGGQLKHTSLVWPSGAGAPTPKLAVSVMKLQ